MYTSVAGSISGILQFQKHTEFILWAVQAAIQHLLRLKRPTRKSVTICSLASGHRGAITQDSLCAWVYTNSHTESKYDAIICLLQKRNLSALMPWQKSDRYCFLWGFLLTALRLKCYFPNPDEVYRFTFHVVKLWPKQASEMLQVCLIFPFTNHHGYIIKSWF